jgi:hypothetical protein
VMTTAMSAGQRLSAPIAIAWATSALTADCSVINVPETPTAAVLFFLV